ncbi:hypothetical protein [Chryseobacterium lathyri]|uniref:Uncharacterized protein n=1 Tax=Chryseobacterium lathyri TaxID=395933 RepID=A0A511YFW0_9FLAO|nr:hypothetical protein [Chryseobacterium lathyri]GEN74084.1 hypothetical protein CLA01_41560 [Chryseobacterium lathyri]
MAGIDYSVFYIPEGIPNIKEYFPNIDFSEVDEWTVYVKDSQDNILATSRRNINGCCCIDDKVRIHFINSLGEIDSINFILSIEEHETKSDTWKKSQKSPLNRTKGGSYRQNITSNETIEAETRCYSESDQYWIKELMDSPVAWIETLLPNGFHESNEKEFIPIEISDMKFNPKKNKGRYEYIVKIKFSMSNDNSTHR